MSKTKSKTPQTHPTCVFCGCQPLTNEHLWPQWIKEIIPLSEVDHLHERGSLGGLGVKVDRTSKIVKRPITSKLPVNN